MKIINIFLAGSLKMVAERNLVRSIANKIQADQCAKGRDIAINITTFENFNSAIMQVSAQESYDNYIHSDADYAMFIFDNEVGGISKHEFDIAFDASKKNNKPKLYVYFKKSDNYCKDYEEIRQLLIGTNNYFLVYNDFVHLSMMLNNHLLEIIDVALEEIILKSYKKKGYLTLVTNCDCSVYEGDDKLADTQSSKPRKIELTEGIHCLSFKDNESSRMLVRKIHIQENNPRTIKIRFSNENNNKKPSGNSFNIWHFILTALVIIATTILIVRIEMKETDIIIDDKYLTDEYAGRGGQTYQEALSEMQNGNLMLAADKLQIVINKDPDFADPYIHLASIYIQQNNYEDAKALLNTALTLNPNSEWAKRLKVSIPF